MKPETYAALVAAAAELVDDDADREKTNTAFSAISDWYELAAQAEQHGLSVMLGRLAATGCVQLPRELDLQLKALTIRHQKVLAARRIVLAEVIDILDRHQIRFAFLKGAALSELIYSPAWLRPMRDIDLLVSPAQALETQRLLRDVGFANEDRQSGYLFEHHHLPNSIRIQDGFTISLEVHHDALSGDAEASITLDRLEDQLQPYRFADRTAYALGHTDMLKHLCFHTFEPADLIKLGSIVDLVRYAAHYVDEIDWRALDSTHAFITNTLRCVHALVPLPNRLQAALQSIPNANWQPAGLGRGFVPLSRISRLSAWQRFRALFSPSAWWLHIYYVVPANHSLLYTRLVRHPGRVTQWLLRRYRAAYRSRNR